MRGLGIWQKLSYETGITTFAQLVIIVPLAFLNGMLEIFKSCTGNNTGNCMINSIFSMFFVLVLAGWFGFVCMLGYAVQEKRGRLFAKLLILAELAVIPVSLFVIQNPARWLDVVIGFIALVLAFWTIVLALRVHQAKGSRIVARTRPRRRLHQD